MKSSERAHPAVIVLIWGIAMIIGAGSWWWLIKVLATFTGATVLKTTTILAALLLIVIAAIIVYQRVREDHTAPDPCLGSRE